jgi:hypothetical protein
MTFIELIQFLEKQRDTKALKFQTARTRITAIRKIFEVLPEYDQTDVLNLDLSHIQSDFIETYGNQVSLPTIVTYISRIRSSVRLYRDFSSGKLSEEDELQSSLPKNIEPIDIQIRDGLKVNITNLPNDLKKAEVERICRVLEAYIN